MIFFLLRLSIQQTPNSNRIVIVSSLAHESGKIHWDDIHFEKSYNRVTAYNQSKLANVMHAKSLARKVKDSGVDVFSLHPGKEI